MIGRNAGRGPGAVNLSLRLSRTWGFGSLGESGPADKNAPPPGMGGVRGDPGPGGPRGGGPPGGGPPGGGPPGVWRVDTQAIQPHALRDGAERVESSELCQPEWRPILAFLWAIAQPAGR